MFTIEEAAADDFERVLPCLKRFDKIGQGNSDEVWRRIFTAPWESLEDFWGCNFATLC